MKLFVSFWSEFKKKKNLLADVNEEENERLEDNRVGEIKGIEIRMDKGRVSRLILSGGVWNK